MKLKSLVFGLVFGLISQVHAVNMHMNANVDAADKKSIEKGLMYPGFREIEIINDSFSDVSVYGTFDDGASTYFNVYRFESPHYISLFYYYYCHSGMYITINTPYYTVYSGWTDVNSTIRIVPFLKKQVKAEITEK